MFRKMLLSLTVVLMLSGMVTSVSAVDVNWTGGSLSSDPNWDDTFNWDIVPTAVDSVHIDSGGGIPFQPLISTGVVAVGGVTRVGETGDGSLTVTGGSLTLASVGDHLILGEGDGSTGTLEVSGGSVSADSLWVGNSGDGLFVITGGTVTLNTEGLYVDRFNKTDSTAVLAGGTVDANGLTIGTYGLVDIGGSTLTIHGDVGVWVDLWVAGGKMKAYSGGAGATLVHDYNTTTPGKTTVTATGYTKAAWMPNPSDGQTSVAWDADLSWFPNSGITNFDVYFGTVTPPVTKVSTAQPGTTYNPAGDLAIDTTYYWRIDGNGGSITGDVWSFTTRGYEAYDPDPMDQAGDVSADKMLSWTAASNAVSHDVYIGTDAGAVADANTNDDECVSIEQADPNYTPGSPLTAGETYYWRIDEYDSGDVVTKGPVWEFTVFVLTSLSWDDGAVGNHLWNDPCNWSTDQDLPGAVTGLGITVGTGQFGPVIDSSVTAVCEIIRFYGPEAAAETVLTMTGGTLDTYNHVIISEDGNCIMDMNGGVANLYSLWVGNKDDATLNMDGGTITVTTGTFLIAGFAGDGHVQLDGGVLNGRSLTMGGAQGGAPSMDITGGTLTLEGDVRSHIDGYVTSGYITGYGGSGFIAADFGNTNPGKTTVTACATGSDADFTGDCTVDAEDLKILTDSWLVLPPAEKLWEFDMSTDPVGSDANDLTIRETYGAYNMTDLAGALHVTGGQCLLDTKGDSQNAWDVTLDYTAKAGDSDGIGLWIAMNSPSASACTLVGVLITDEGSSQTVKIGEYMLGGGYAVQETGFADDTMLDIDITYHYSTQKLDWSITDGSKTESGTDQSYAGIPTFGGDATGFTIHHGNLSGGTGDGYIDYLRFHCAGSGEAIGAVDINNDGEVNFEDFAELAEDWLI